MYTQRYKQLAVLSAIVIFLGLTTPSPAPPEDPPSEAEKVLAPLADSEPRAAKMLRVLREKKAKYPKVAREIDAFVLQIAAAEFMPNTRRGQPVRPIIVVGPPNIGKTSFVNEVVDELELRNVFKPLRMREGQTYIPFQTTLASPNLGKTRGVQLIIFADEIQNVVRQNEAKARNEEIKRTLELVRRTMTEQKMSDVDRNTLQGMMSALQSFNYTGMGQLQEEQLSDFVLWHLTGNGILKLEPPGMDDRTIQDHRARLSNFLELLASTKREREELVAKIAAETNDETKKGLEQQLKNLNDGEKELRLTRQAGYSLEDLGDTIRNYLPFKPHLYRDLVENETINPDRPIGDEILRIIKANPKKAAEILQRNIVKQGFEQDTDASRVIIVMAGNTQKFLERTLAKAHDARDPNSVHKAGAALLREEGKRRAAEEVLFPIFGKSENAAAFFSRMGDIEPKLTLSEEEFDHAVKSMVNEFLIRLKADFHHNKIPVDEIAFSQELAAYLSTSLKPYHLDGRFVLNEINRELSAASHTALVGLQLDPAKGAKTKHVIFRFDPAKRTIVVDAKTDSKVETAVATFESAVTPPTAPGDQKAVVVSDAKPREASDYRRQKAVNRASVATVGLLFGSAPRRLSIEDEAFLRGDRNEMWPRGELDSLSYWRNQLLVELAGLAGEAEFMEETPHSERAIADRSHAKVLLEKIMDQLRTLQAQRLGQVPSAEGRIPVSDLLPHRFHEVVFADINRGLTPDQILEASLKYVKKELRKSERLVSRLAQELLANETLSPEQTRFLISANTPKDTSKQIANAEPGSIRDNPCRLNLARIGWIGRRWEGVRYYLPWVR